MNKGVDNLCIYDERLTSFAEKFFESVGDGNSAAHGVGTMADLDAALNSYNGVRFLEVALHGSPGMFNLRDTTAIVGSYINKMVKNPVFLKKEARILFDTCSIGADDCGDKFMDSIGAGMLFGKGGIVGATTVSNLAVMISPWAGVYMLPFSNGRLKVRHYDASGKRVASRTVGQYGNAR